MKSHEKFSIDFIQFTVENISGRGGDGYRLTWTDTKPGFVPTVGWLDYGDDNRAKAKELAKDIAKKRRKA